MLKNKDRLTVFEYPYFIYGAPYYPEHWSPEERKNDPEWMKEANFNTVRMAEFAWDMLEKKEVVFDFSFLDEQIARLGKYGIKTFLGTPTAAPPRWLSKKYPQIVRIDDNGKVMQHGSRQHACTTGELFRSFSRRITQAMAEHYADNPDVIGFQTDNELNCHFQWCYCKECEKEFKVFLKQKYGTIERLNQSWGNAFWAQTLDDFDDVILPKFFAPTHHNPGAMLDYRRFITAMVARFQREQIDILRAANPKWLIFHNGTMAGVDYRSEFTYDLNVLGYDSYPHFHMDGALRPAITAFNYAEMHSYSGNFIIPEMQSNAGGQTNYFNAIVEKNEQRLNTYRAVSQGADGIMYFRWRTCRYGAEEYWRGIIDHDNIKRDRYYETARTGEELQKLWPVLKGSSPVAQIAVATGDYDVHSMHEIYSLGLPAPREIARDVHNFFYRRHFLTGAAHPADPMDGIKVFILPHWEYIAPEWAENLENFVKDGGVLIIGCRCGTRNIDNQIVAETFPGILGKLSGVKVEQYGKFAAEDHRVYSINLAGKSVRAKHFIEELSTVSGVETIGCWENRAFAGKSAVTLHNYGRGKVIYCGTYLTPDLMESLIPLLPTDELIKFDLPDGVEVARRSGVAGDITFLLNSTEQTCNIPEKVLAECGTVAVGDNDTAIAPMEVKVLLKKF